MNAQEELRRLVFASIEHKSNILFSTKCGRDSGNFDQKEKYLWYRTFDIS